MNDKRTFLSKVQKFSKKATCLARVAFLFAATGYAMSGEAFTLQVFMDELNAAEVGGYKNNRSSRKSKPENIATAGVHQHSVRINELEFESAQSAIKFRRQNLSHFLYADPADGQSAEKFSRRWPEGRRPLRGGCTKPFPKLPTS